MAKCVVYINLFLPLLTANVGGVFLVLGFGCLFALIVALIEFLWNVKKVAVDERVSCSDGSEISGLREVKGKENQRCRRENRSLHPQQAFVSRCKPKKLFTVTSRTSLFKA